ncbi:MAG: BMC domain-containing protein [Actinomycetota bacterium]|nr:BMC domain-containing protein [Actinomycetota bacterium]MDK1016957.1 BMC domain-containing protein [Actinomycetota bacterium]MDK1026623.1 BMC domain-containing protein [Actinomycetota bacterium]MDK1037789.1 BMC domain-containing protein [Actinomycetota bacterium]MDK1096247.1 BMC domain-containing protein [Actinomycetota bacterium]
MSEHRSPAVALWEFVSIVEGVNAADAIAKGSPIDVLYTGTTHPGKYVVLVAGDTASVEVATEIVEDLETDLIDSVFLPDIAPTVADAIVTSDPSAPTTGDAVGLVETLTVASGVDAADAAVKAANVRLAALRMADGVDGKAYIVVEGAVGEVEAAVDAGVARAGDNVIASVVIAQLTDELRIDLAASAGFLERVRSHRLES